MKTQELIMLDITAPTDGVQVQVREDGKVLWVNVDGLCRLRICQIPELKIEDNRSFHEKLAEQIVEGITLVGLSSSTWREKHPQAYTDLIGYTEDLKLSVLDILRSS